MKTILILFTKEKSNLNVLFSIQLWLKAQKSQGYTVMHTQFTVTTNLIQNAVFPNDSTAPRPSIVNFIWELISFSSFSRLSQGALHHSLSFVTHFNLLLIFSFSCRRPPFRKRPPSFQCLILKCDWGWSDTQGECCDRGGNCCIIHRVQSNQSAPPGGGTAQRWAPLNICNQADCVNVSWAETEVPSCSWWCAYYPPAEGNDKDVDKQAQ